MYLKEHYITIVVDLKRGLLGWKVQNDWSIMDTDINVWETSLLYIYLNILVLHNLKILVLKTVIFLQKKNL